MTDNEGDAPVEAAAYRLVVLGNSHKRRPVLAIIAVAAMLPAVWTAFGDASTNDVRSSVARLFVGLCALDLSVLDRPTAPSPAPPALRL